MSDLPQKEKEPSVKKWQENSRNARRKKRMKEDKLVNRVVSVIVLLVVIAIISFSFYTYRHIKTSLMPYNAKDEEIVFVEIPIGSSNKAIGKILEENKIIKDGTVFNFYTKFNNLSGFQAGRYQFSPSMTLGQIGAILKTGGLAADQADARVTIPEGYDITQIAETVAEATSFSKEEFIQLMEKKDYFATLEKKYPNLLTDVAQVKDVRYALEGYLFPATYDYFEGMTLEDFVTQMVAKMDEIMSNYYAQIEASGWNVHEILTLSSLVEKEGVTEEDRRMIAQVFFNRLAIDMPLQSDISILYALGVHKELVTYEDAAVDSPYNLYVNNGFGPGPFNSPGEMAIQAVLEPTANEYYYFVADLATGEVYFSKTLEEHNLLVEQYVNKTQ